MRLINLSKAALTAVVCALTMTAQAQETIGSFTIEGPATDSVLVEEDNAARDTSVAATPKRAFDGVWMKSADNTANDCRMAINFYEKKSRKTVETSEEVTLSCYGVIFIGNADGYVPDYCTILTAQIDGNRAAITFKSSRDSNTYSADLVSSADGSTVKVENVKLRKVVWSPTPQTMLKNGMEFVFTGEEK